MRDVSVVESKRMSLNIPIVLYNEIVKMANEEAMSPLDILRSFVRLGLFFDKVSKDPDSEFIVRKNGQDKIVIWP